MSGFVVCPACGTQIKSGRLYCLRCLALLPQAAATPPSKPASIRLSRSAGAGVAVLGAALVAFVTVNRGSRATRPETRDNARRPASTAVSPGSSPANAAPTVSASPEPASDAFEFLAPTRDDDMPAASDLDNARSTLERSLEKQPDDPATMNALGQVLARLDRLDDAMARFERAIARAPNNPAYHFNRAYVASGRRQWTQAIEGYGAAARLAPADYAAQFNFALALHRRGDRADAVREFQKASAMAPGEATVHMALATALANADQLADAAREYRRFLEIEPNSAKADIVRERLDRLFSGQGAPRPPGA